MNTRALLIALLVSGCVAAPVVAPESAWTPDEGWWAEATRSGGTLTAQDGSLRFVNALHAKNLYEVSREIRAQSALEAEIALVDDAALNAYASGSGGRRQIAFSLKFLAAIGDDRDALATTLGHEAAHLYYAHAAARMVRSMPAQAVAYAMGSLPGAMDMPMAGIAGTIAINTSFSRYEEREADLKGLEWAVAAGYSPCGSARTFRILARRRISGAAAGYNATHPGHEERIQRANAMARRLTGRVC